MTKPKEMRDRELYDAVARLEQPTRDTFPGAAVLVTAADIRTVLAFVKRHTLRAEPVDDVAPARVRRARG